MLVVKGIYFKQQFKVSILNAKISSFLVLLSWQISIWWCVLVLINTNNLFKKMIQLHVLMYHSSWRILLAVYFLGDAEQYNVVECVCLTHFDDEWRVAGMMFFHTDWPLRFLFTRALISIAAVVRYYHDECRSTHR